MIRLEIEIKIELEFNQSEKIKSISNLINFALIIKFQSNLNLNLQSDHVFKILDLYNSQSNLKTNCIKCLLQILLIKKYQINANSVTFNDIKIVACIQ